MTDIIEFSGASDDLIHVSGPIDKYDEVGAKKLPSGNDGAIFVLTQGDRAARITVEYVAGGVWAIGVAPYDEGHPMPEGMTMGVCDYCDYSAMLSIPYVAGTTITREV